MSEGPREAAPPPEHERHERSEPSPMPGWVPALIGVLLVTMAGLAVFTGLRYRQSGGMTRLIHTRRPVTKTMASAPPGEPAPGASLLYPGDAENVPVANEPVTGRARAEITGGGAEGITSTIRIWARRGMMTNVVPDDALIYVNNLPVGQAKQFATMDEVYDFAAPGSYTIRLVAPGFKERQFVVTAAENARQEIARIDVKLDKQSQ
jgi:hypothetical protein